MSLQAMEERDGTISLLRKRLEQAERQQRVQVIKAQCASTVDDM